MNKPTSFQKITSGVKTLATTGALILALNGCGDGKKDGGNLQSEREKGKIENVLDSNKGEMDDKLGENIDTIETVNSYMTKLYESYAKYAKDIIGSSNKLGLTWLENGGFKIENPLAFPAKLKGYEKKQIYYTNLTINQDNILVEYLDSDSQKVATYNYKKDPKNKNIMLYTFWGYKKTDIPTQKINLAYLKEKVKARTDQIFDQWAEEAKFLLKNNPRLSGM